MKNQLQFYQFTPKPTQFQQEFKQQRVDLFKQQIEKMIETTKEALEKTNSRQSLNNNSFRNDFTKEELQNIIMNGTAVEQAKLSRYFFKISGVYKRIIIHYATFLTYSWLMIPHMKKYKDKINNPASKNIYYNAADFCSNFGIERHCALFATQVLIQGGYYGLIHDNGSSVAIQELPFEYCRSRYKNYQDIEVVEFDVRFFDTIRDEEIKRRVLKNYPKVVQKGYRDYKEKGNNNPWVFLPEELAFYFNLFEERPFFLDLIPLIDDLEDYKQIDKQRNLQGLKRIITQELPHDGMQLVFEPEEGQVMHEGVLEMIADNPDCDAITSYGKVGLLNLSGNVNDHTELEDAQQLIYDSAGVSKELFSAQTEAGLQFSINNDLSMMMVLGQKFAHFFTALLNNKFGNRKMSFRLLILPVSIYNRDEYVAKAKDLAAFGYSFLTPVAGYGLGQTDLSDLKALENDVLDLDEVLKPLQSAYTQSGKTNAVTAAASKNSTASAGGNEQNKETTSSSSEKQAEKSDTAAEKKSDGGENK